jgi:hypothetical protein
MGVRSQNLTTTDPPDKIFSELGTDHSELR